MRALAGALAVMVLSTVSALAATTEGTIAKLDKASMTLTLDDGKAYKLSEEFSVEDYSEGMSVTISYDEIDGKKIVLQIIPD